MDDEVEAPTNESSVKTFTQEEVNRIIGERVKRATPEDYDELKAKAAKFDEVEQAQKSQEEKLRDEIAQLTNAKAAAETQNVRLSVLASSGIPAEYQELVHGSTREELESSAEKVKALLEASNKPASPANQYVIPSEGKSPSFALNDESSIEASLNRALGIN